jgi:UDP-glucose:(heptosyl)LPS alpha-1,3-glucosyltransferase
MSQKPKLVVAIHDLNPWGGQDKSNLEILYHLSQQLPIEIHAYQFVDTRKWPNLTFTAYHGLRRPLFIKALSYGIKTFFAFRNLKKKDKSHVIIQSTGTAAWNADVFQIQFIHKTWQSLQNNYDLEEESGLLRSLYHQFLQNFNIWIENRLFNKNKKYIAISHSIKKELMEHFHIPERNIATIYHGVDTEHFKPPSTEDAISVRVRLRTELRIPNDATVLLHCGALNQRKGVPIAIETLGFLKNQGFDNIHYVAVGAGDTSYLKKSAEKQNILDQVHFIQHSKNIRDYYWMSDIFFFPTVYEPFGLVILEAMACGLPCVVSASAGGSELIVHGENGVLLENILDPEAMAQQLSEFLKNKLLQKQISTQAFATAKEHSWQRVAEEYLKFYETFTP